MKALYYLRKLTIDRVIARHMLGILRFIFEAAKVQKVRAILICVLRELSGCLNALHECFHLNTIILRNSPKSICHKINLRLIPYSSIDCGCHCIGAWLSCDAVCLRDYAMITGNDSSSSA